MSRPRLIHVYYEHPRWFRPLFAELERRGIPHVAVDASRHRFAAMTAGGSTADPPTLVFNRMSPSAAWRGHGNAILYTLQYLRELEARGVPVVNGLDAFTVETSKALQVGLVERLGLAAPRTRVVNHPTELVAAARDLEFPLLVKPNIGGSGAGIVRFESPDQLEALVEQDLVPASLDGILLLQEFHPPLDGVVRIETLEGRFLYAIRVRPGDASDFNLCPADLCRGAAGRPLHAAGCAQAPASGATVERYEPPAEARRQAEALARAARLDVGGVEYLESARDGRRYFFDVNALSNFVADPLAVLGFDPIVPLVDVLAFRAHAGVRVSGAPREPWVRRTSEPAAAAWEHGFSGRGAEPPWVAPEEMAPAGLPASRSVVAPLAAFGVRS